MRELIHEAFLPVNLGFTILLSLIVLYWLSVIIGAMDAEFLNFDLDADIDADVDMDLDGDIATPDMLRTFLGFFHVGKVPIMVLLSILILSLWIISLMSNYYLNPDRGMFIGTGIALGNLVASLMITKVVLMPFAKVFESFNNDDSSTKKIVGRICIITTTKVSDKMGQAEIKTTAAPILINAKTEDGCTLNRGDEAVVVGHDKDKSIYYVMPVEIGKMAE
ncbi:MAG: DUF1449 family protein [Phycisphaerae bacterium]|nr:DUF1449 family protein [Phycisphaerae bacterium]